MSLLKFAKFKKGDKTIVFKHSPHLDKKALERIKSNDSQHIRDKTIRKYIDDFKEYKEPKHSYYWKYANNKVEKAKVDEKTIFCYNERENEEVNKQLQENDYYMVFGHCGTTATNSSTYSIIDKDWDNYQYSKFSVDKNKQLKHEVYYAKNKIIKTYQIKNFEKAKRRDEKINNKKLSIVPNNNIYFKPQKKNFNVLNISNVNSLSINNKVPKRDMGPQAENKIEFSKSQRMEFAYDDANSSNSVCNLNACCNWIGSTCG